MKKNTKIKILLPVSITILTLLVGLILNTNRYDTYEELTKQGTQIAMYVEGDDGNYQLSDTNQFPTYNYKLNNEKSNCTNDGKITQNMITKKISVKAKQNMECNLYFDKWMFNVVEAIQDINNNLKPKGVNGIVSDFGVPATTNIGVFEMKDDYGTSYYYRGDVDNNYVQFADFYWRIIRLNGDGSLRIIYDGTNIHANGESNDDRFTKVNQWYNDSARDAKYVGWMYGPAGESSSKNKEEAQSNTSDSVIKDEVDTWYKTNIVDKGFSSLVSDTLFCNDRTTPGKDITGYSSDTALGYAKNYTAYGAYARLYNGGKEGGPNYNNPKPTFNCPQKNDTFTVKDTTKGNGKLTYPIGLITADEIVAAGSGKFGTANKNYYLYKSSKYRTLSMSPGGFLTGNASVFSIYSNGQLVMTNTWTNASGVYVALAPVINLSKEYASTMIGTGTIADPYRSK